MRILLFDLETTALTAIMWRVLCCSFMDLATKNVYTFRLDDKNYKTSNNPISDHRLVVAIRNELEKANMIVGHNCKMFDIPLLNARLAKWGERPLRKQFVFDTRWYFNGNSMRIGSAKLDNVAKFFKFENQKTPLDWEEWSLAAMHDKTAMGRVVEHCEADVRSLEEAYWKALPFVRNLSA